MYVEVKDLPHVIQDALKSVSYGKKDISLTVKDTESVFCSGGDGRRGFALIINLSTGEKKELWGSWGGSNMFNPKNTVDTNDTSYPIPENTAVITGSIGEKTYATIALSPKNVLPVLKAKPEVTDEEKEVLDVFCTYIASYRKPYLSGKETVIEGLVSKGMLNRNKAGSLSITTAGKNVVR